MAENTELMTVDNICNRVYVIRGQQVMLDYDLAEIYGYEVKRLNEQVKRNIARFPEDFMFQLTKDEDKILKSQIATSSWGGKRKLPYAFTEQGIYMLATVLRGEPTEQAYHCGASSKDAGKKLCAINAISETSMIHPVIDRLLSVPDRQI